MSPDKKSPFERGRSVFITDAIRGVAYKFKTNTYTEIYSIFILKGHRNSIEHIISKHDRKQNKTKKQLFKPGGMCVYCGMLDHSSGWVKLRVRVCVRIDPSGLRWNDASIYKLKLSWISYNYLEHVLYKRRWSFFLKKRWGLKCTKHCRKKVFWYIAE